MRNKKGVIAVLLWGLITGSTVAAQEFFTLKGHGGPVHDLAVSPSGRIATASFDNTVGVWQDREPRWLENHEAAVKSLAWLDDGTLASGGDDNALVIWDLAAGMALRREGHTAKIAAVRVSPAADLIATASWDGRIGLWPRQGGAARFLTGHTSGVNDVAFAADGTRLYSGASDGTIREWDVTTGAEIRQVQRHGFGINRLAMGPGGAWLAYGATDGGTRVIAPDTGESLADLTLGRRPILGLAVSRDGGLLAVGDGEGFIMVVETDRWRIARDFRATARGPVWALGFSPDGSNIHAGGLDDVMYSWPLESLDAHDQMTTGNRSFLEDPATLGNGERQFKRKCSICHALTEDGQRRAGPTLFGLFGRPAGTVPGYFYSQTLIGSDFVWNADTIDALFDLGPDHFIPGSKMPMQRIVAARDRADLIDYLRQATAPDKE